MAKRVRPVRVPLPDIHEDPRGYALALIQNRKVDLYCKSPVEKAQYMLAKSQERLGKLRAANAPDIMIENELRLTAKYERRLERARNKGGKV